jgi:hypothetical protein
MCMQCMIGAMTAGAGASGTRAWLGRMRASWLTPKRMRRITIALVAAALAVSTTISGSTPSGGSTAGPAHAAGTAAAGSR